MENYNSCGTFSLISIDGRCDTYTGGIKEIYIAPVDDVTSITIDSTTNPNELITEITMASEKKFQKWLFRPNTGSYTSTGSDSTAGNVSFTTEVSLQFNKAEAQKRIAIQAAINAGCVIIIKDMYGKYLLLGKEADGFPSRNPAYITSSVMQSGTANTDLSGFTLTFQEVAGSMPHFIDETKVTISNLVA